MCSLVYPSHSFSWRKKISGGQEWDRWLSSLTYIASGKDNVTGGDGEVHWHENTAQGKDDVRARQLSSMAWNHCPRQGWWYQSSESSDENIAAPRKTGKVQQPW